MILKQSGSGRPRVLKEVDYSVITRKIKENSKISAPKLKMEMQ